MEYLSLYDYLGKPAGDKLGIEVAAAAKNSNIKLESRDVETPKYKGKILLYPKDFLESYFREPESIQIEDLPGEIDWSDSELEDDDLPF
jgi:hypothetical protein